MPLTQSEIVGPSQWTMVELLGQRSLLGFGAFLTWLVLFHLLVNIWLLCVFTSLLVVLGGWLGSQAVLDSNSVVHLERFVTLERVPCSSESERQLDHEIQTTVRKIIRDFVTSWYCMVSSERDFEVEVQSAMYSMAMELKSRSRRVDRKVLTQRVLDLCGGHLQSYLRAMEIMAELEKEGDGKNSLCEAYFEVCTPHPAVKSSAMEVNYTRAIVDLLLHVLVPPPHLETRTGRFVVGELITCNVLLPFITKLSDPDWLNLLIVAVFTKSSMQAPKASEPPKTPSVPELTVLEQEQPQQDIQVPCSLPLRILSETPIDTEAATPELAAYDIIDSAELYGPQNNIEEEEPRQNLDRLGICPIDYLRRVKSNPFYQETDSDLDSPLTDFKRSSMESLVLIGAEEELSDRFRECATPTDISSVIYLEDDLRVYPGLAEDISSPKVLVSELQNHSDPIANILCPTTENVLLNFGSLQDLDTRESITNPDRELDLGSGCQPNGFTASVSGHLQTSSPMAPLPSFSFEPLSSPEGPIIIQNLRIAGTITAKEHRGTGSHPYTLYTVKYETAMDSENPGTIQPVAYHTVNRRYSEFLNLQTRLEEKSDLRKLIKNVKGPKKIFPDLPFGNMDSEKVEARKGLLETFLKQLCAIPETANSEEMQEFLALNTDARIAFVKKPFIVSHIDKIVDTLKTAFPRSELQSPTEEMDGDTEGKLYSEKKNKSRLRFSSKSNPVLNVSDMRPKVVYCFDERSTVFNRLSVTGLEAFIKEQELAVMCDAEPERQDSPGLRGEVGGCGFPRNNVPDESSEDSVAETAQADIALDIMCLLMKDQWSWLCTDNIQKTIRLLFGTLIERWLDVSVANLTCTQYWVFYLRVLQEAVWPGGSLPAQPRPERSKQQKEDTKDQSLHCLMRLLPDLLSDMLGSDKYKLSWQTALESLQDPYINRHLVYCIWDLLLEFLVPETSEEDFQKTLLQSLSKNAEKLPL
ncbi:sorting nexin-19 [Esox lucius]|uniref:Sorting nexin 19b n=1 Tax=Esox lucius TaxID=8010 RepID=A0A3P8Z880_ESOLU|nr:sorting nexin-19 [Esox lucius]XP_010891984.1 sorting nexin-19 [Esox lucius]